MTRTGRGGTPIDPRASVPSPRIGGRAARSGAQRAPGAVIGALMVTVLLMSAFPAEGHSGPRLTETMAQVPTPTSPLAPGRVGLLIEYGDGRIETSCVDIGDPFGVSAEQLLLNAPVEVHMFREYGNIAVCRIGGEGCPTEQCYCAYAGDAPQSRLWLSYRLRNGAWQRPEPAEVLLSRRRVFPGDVEAWIWGYPGDGHGQGAARPSRVITFAEICAVATPTATPTGAPTPTDTPAPTGTPLATDTPLPTETELPTAESQPPEPAQNAPIIFPAASATPPRLPTFARPSPTATFPTQATTPPAASEAIYLPLVRGAVEAAAPLIATPPVAILEPTGAPPMPTAPVQPSPTPQLDLTATAAILQTEFAVPPAPSATVSNRGAAGAGRPVSPATPTAPPVGATPSPRATRPAADALRSDVAPSQAPVTYPAPQAVISRSAEGPISLVPWLALAVGIAMLILLALVLVQRRASHHFDDDAEV